MENRVTVVQAVDNQLCALCINRPYLHIEETRAADIDRLCDTTLISLIRVLQFTINELSESSLRANQGLNDNFEKERTQLLENIQIVSQQRDELANSIVELKKLVVTLETDLKSLQQARAADAVTMKVIIFVQP